MSLEMLVTDLVQVVVHPASFAVVFGLIFYFLYKMNRSSNRKS